MLPMLLTAAPGSNPPPQGLDPLAADPMASLYALPEAPPYNSPMRTVTPTYDGSGEAIHPSVIDFHQEPTVGADWHGWRYWAAVTPYPSADPTKENPSILVSNNGFYWQPPIGLTRNPLYWPQPGTSNPVLSDTHLVYEPDRDGLLLLYRDNGLDFKHLIARSPDGLTWPAAASELVFTSTQQNVSPCLVRLSASDWRMFGIYKDSRTINMWRASDPYGTWEGPFTCVGIVTGGLWPWHLDVQHDGTKFTALIDRGAASYPDGYRAATSTDGINWTLAGSNFLDVRAEPNWDSRQLYRACHTNHEDGRYRVWYSAAKLIDGGSEWGTGYTIVPGDTWPAAPTLTAGSGTAYRDAVLTDTPAVYWRLGEQYDDTATADTSGNARPGVWSGARARATGLVPDADYSSRLHGGQATRAHDAWMTAAAYTAEAVIAGSTTGVIVGVDDTASRGWYLGRRAGNLRWEAPGSALVLEWYGLPSTACHVAVTVGAGTVRLYVNGVEKVSASATPTAPASPAGLTVGGGPYGNFLGTLDEVAVYTTALSPARILAHAQAAGLT